MKPEQPFAPGNSLIERAAQSYDFGDLLRAGPQAPVLLPEESPRQVAPPPVMPIPDLPRPIAPQVATPEAPAPYLQQPVVAPQTRSVPRPRTGYVAQLDLEHLRAIGFLEPGASPSTLSEEFRLAKRQILLSAFGGRNVKPVERGRAVMICSSQPNEGKTFCSINLALSMASEREVEVVLVDADVAKPEVLSILGIEGGPGLMDAIANPAVNIEDLLIRTSLPSVSILPTGRRSHDDTEMLASDNAHNQIDALLANNPRRIVIIDSAPALAASPASVMAHHVGQIVMVVRADKTGENELREAISLLSGCEHMQLLLNGVTYSGVANKYGSYYGYGG